jgi:hypothetical protein
MRVVDLLKLTLGQEVDIIFLLEIFLFPVVHFRVHLYMQLIVWYKISLARKPRNHNLRLLIIVNQRIINYFLNKRLINLTKVNCWTDYVS